MSYWAEIRSDFIDERENKVYIDAWFTMDDSEEGEIIAKIDLDTKEVEYLDDSAMTDAYAQEVIQSVIAAL